MKYLEKTWIRILVSLFGGGLLAEILFISTGDPNRPRNQNAGWGMLPLLFAFILYILLTYIVNKRKA